MASLLTRLKQLIMRDVLPLKEARAEEVFRASKSIEWNPGAYFDLIECATAWAEKTWPLLLSETENLLFSPWQMVHSLKTLDHLAGTEDFLGSLKQWNQLQQIISGIIQPPKASFGQMLWHHHDLVPLTSLSEEMLLWMGLTIESLDFDAESASGRINRWLFRSTDELSVNPVKGISGWCWAGARFAFQGEWGRECRIYPSPEIVFSPKIGRKIVCPTIRILGMASYQESEEGQAFRLLIDEGKLELIFWQSASPHGESTISPFAFPEGMLEMPVSLQMPTFPFSKLHRLRHPLKALGLEEWFEPASQRLAKAFQGQPAWLDELVMGASFSMHAHPRPKRHIEPAQHSHVFDRPFGIMVRECKSKLPLILGWIKHPIDSLTESLY